MDVYFLILLVVMIIGAVIIVTSWFGLKKKAINMQVSTMQKPKNNNIQVFEVMEFALNEINKCGEEMMKLGVTKEQLKPLQDRYNKLKWVKEHEGLTLPLLNIGSKVITDFVKGLI